MLSSSSSMMLGSALYFESETLHARADVNYGTRQLQTHTVTHFGLEVLCALNAAITPAKYDHRRQRYKPHHAPLLELC
jgi:hypothetical protein